MLTLQDIGVPWPPRDSPRLSKPVCPWCLSLLLTVSSPQVWSLLPSTSHGGLDSDSYPSASPQKPGQELTQSWAHKPSRNLDKAEAMAPPPPPPPPPAVNTPLLHGEFGSYPARGSRFALTLTPQALYIQRLRPKPEARPRGGLVPLTEVSGCCTLRSQRASDPAAYFCIYTYPQGKRGGRRRTARTFQADGAATYEENRAEVQHWATVLMCLLRGLPLPGDRGEAPQPSLPRLSLCGELPPLDPVVCMLCLSRVHRTCRHGLQKKETTAQAVSLAPGCSLARFCLCSIPFMGPDHR